MPPAGHVNVALKHYMKSRSDLSHVRQSAENKFATKPQKLPLSLKAAKTRSNSQVIDRKFERLIYRPATVNHACRIFEHSVR